jgi:hypothetical protein
LSRFNIARLRSTIRWRDEGSMAPRFSSCVSVREMVSIVLARVRASLRASPRVAPVAALAEQARRNRRPCAADSHGLRCRKTHPSGSCRCSIHTESSPRPLLSGYFFPCTVRRRFRQRLASLGGALAASPKLRGANGSGLKRIGQFTERYHRAAHFLIYVNLALRRAPSFGLVGQCRRTPTKPRASANAAAERLVADQSDGAVLHPDIRAGCFDGAEGAALEARRG